MSTIETTGVKIRTEGGVEINYKSGMDATSSIEGTRIFPSGRADGAVVIVMGVDGAPGVHEIHTESPLRQTQLETVDQAIELLTEVRDALAGRASA